MIVIERESLPPPPSFETSIFTMLLQITRLLLKKMFQQQQKAKCTISAMSLYHFLNEKYGKLPHISLASSVILLTGNRLLKVGYQFSVVSKKKGGKFWLLFQELNKDLI